MGVKVEGARLGLGVSLFSEQKTVAEETASGNWMQSFESFQGTNPQTIIRHKENEGTFCFKIISIIGRETVKSLDRAVQ